MVPAMNPFDRDLLGALALTASVAGAGMLLSAPALWVPTLCIFTMLSAIAAVRLLRRRPPEAPTSA